MGTLPGPGLGRPTTKARLEPGLPSRGRPDRGRSLGPAMPSRLKRPIQRRTVEGSEPKSSAMVGGAKTCAGGKLVMAL